MLRLVLEQVKKNDMALALCEADSQRRPLTVSGFVPMFYGQVIASVRLMAPDTLGNIGAYGYGGDNQFFPNLLVQRTEWWQTVCNLRTRNSEAIEIFREVAAATILSTAYDWFKQNEDDLRRMYKQNIAKKK